MQLRRDCSTRRDPRAQVKAPRHWKADFLVDPGEGVFTVALRGLRDVLDAMGIWAMSVPDAKPESAS
ncbi:hypothetical protein [Streptomyces caniscabiei]|uniref:hypothetical protein n=1 Tax=Streptomyces caniscabiei TaxID=2746961 RepID=UPI000A36A73D|nr:hypothetical protein [Streptomyces caniscabiei]